MEGGQKVKGEGHMAGKGEDEADEGRKESCSFSHVCSQLDLEDFMNGVSSNANVNRICIWGGHIQLVYWM